MLKNPIKNRTEVNMVYDVEKDTSRLQIGVINKLIAKIGLRPKLQDKTN